jgi:hypothetical protein
MAIDKALYQAPESMEELAETAIPAELEIEIEQDDDEVEIEIELKTATFEDNLAEDMDEGDLVGLSTDILELINIDLDSRRDWEKTYVNGIKLLGLKMEERTDPWDGACGVFHPLLSEAVVKFQSEMIIATFPPSGPVKTKLIGKVTREKEEAADRVREDMNYTPY